MSLIKSKTIPSKNKGLFYETYTVAPAPSRDYYGLQLFQKKFVWLRWKISHGPYLRPVQNVVELEEFLKDAAMQNEISYIFGSDTSDLINNVALEKWTLASMPTVILDRVFKFLNIKDVYNLMQVSKRLQKECSKDEFWEKLCRRRWKILLPSDIQRSSSVGWKQVYKDKVTQKNQKSNLIKNPGKKSSTKPPNRIEEIKSKPPVPESKSSVSLIEKKKTAPMRCASAVYPKEPLVKSNKLNKSFDRSVLPTKSKLTVDDPVGRMSNTKCEGTKASKSFSNITVTSSKKSDKDESFNPKMKIKSVRTRPTSKQLEKTKM